MQWRPRNMPDLQQTNHSSGTERQRDILRITAALRCDLASNDDSLSGELERDASGAYVYTDRAGAAYTFSTTVPAAGAGNAKRVANIVFADGRRQDFLYNGSNQLKAVIDSSGYGIVFDYGANGYTSAACGYNLAVSYVSVSSSCSGAALKVSYGYSGSPAKLTTVTDARLNLTTYSYDRNEISCVQPPGYSSCKIANTYGSPLHAWQVTRQTLADGAVWQFTYSGDYLKARDPEAYAEVEPGTSATVTDPALKVSQYSFAQSSPFSAIDANGKVTEYRFSGGADYSTQPGWSTSFGTSLMEATLPEGNKYSAEYGLRRAVTRQTLHAKPGSPLPDIVTEFGYVYNCDPPYSRQSCAKPIFKKDAKGNQTDYSYATHGGLISELQPAPSVGAARPLKLATYVQKYAYVKTAGGTLVTNATPIWLPNSETLCQTSAGSSSPVCDAAAPQIVTTYEYGANGTADNLLLRGKVVTAAGVSLRSCYGYDARGRKISETSPRAGLATCS
ncbi:hypothetical protein ACVWZA_002532 [Sphingomonas sp. UYAg733]